MKEFRIKVYPFGELSEEVQKKLIDKNRWDLGDNAMQCNSDERIDTLKKFEEIFGISVRYEVSYCGRWSNVSFDESPFYGWNDCADWEIEPEKVSGKLLLRYLNNKWLDLHNPKRYWGKFKWDENGKSLTKKRTSKILWSDECPLTGVCYDVDILNPIYKFLKKPSMNISLQDLIEECVGEFIESWYKEWGFCCDDENFLKEEMENRHEDDLYFADGTLFVGNVSELEELAA